MRQWGPGDDRVLQSELVNNSEHSSAETHHRVDITGVLVY